MFDDRLYKRGALLLHALRLTVGDEAFFATLAAWVADNAYGSVDTDAFVDHLEARNGSKMRALADSWLNELELPQLPRSR